MKLRRLSPGEVALAAEVFGEALNPKKVRVVTGAPTGGFAFVIGRLMVFPTPTSDFAAEDVLTQSWFVHELTHVLQFQTRPFWTLMSWAKVAVSGGYGVGLPAYRYSIPFDWKTLNLEQQARVVEHGWLLRQGVRTAAMPDGATAQRLRPPLVTLALLAAS